MRLNPGAGCAPDPCCSDECSIPWTICVTNPCTGDALAGVSIVVRDTYGETVGTCVTVLADGPVACCTFTLSSKGLYTATLEKSGYAIQRVSRNLECNRPYSSNVPMFGQQRCIKVFGCRSHPAVGASVTVTGGGGASGTTDGDGQFCWNQTDSTDFTIVITAKCHARKTIGPLAACSPNNVAYGLVPDSDHICFGDGAVKKTLVLTNSGGTASATYGPLPVFYGGFGYQWTGMTAISPSASLTGVFQEGLPCADDCGPCGSPWAGTNFGRSNLPTDYGAHPVTVGYILQEVFNGITYDLRLSPLDPLLAYAEWYSGGYCCDYPIEGVYFCLSDTYCFYHDASGTGETRLGGSPPVFASSASYCPLAATFDFPDNGGFCGTGTAFPTATGHTPSLTVVISE